MQETSGPVVLYASIIMFLGIALWANSIKAPAKYSSHATPLPKLNGFDLILFLLSIYGTVFIVQSIIFQFIPPDFTSTDRGKVISAVISLFSLQGTILFVCFASSKLYPQSMGFLFPISLKNTIPAFKTAFFYFIKFSPIVIVVSYIWGAALLYASKKGLITLPERQMIVELFLNTDSTLLLCLLVIATSILAPIAEELVFRKVLFSFLQQELRFPLALIINGILFSLIHQNLMSFLPLCFLGSFLGFVYAKSSDIKVSIFYHSLFNIQTLFLLWLGNDLMR